MTLNVPERLRRVVLALVLAIAAALALRVMYVHDKTWEYRLFPSSTPPKVTFHEREYQRGGPVPTVEQGFVASGRSMGGGLIYAPTRYRTPTVIDVTTGHRVIQYDLMGGP